MVICLAKQRIGFGQLTWDKEINNHCFFGTALRYQYYDDNTTATVEDINGFRVSLYKTKSP
jgi:outer membrane receptor for ferrienterochelin and colicins